MPTTTGGSRDPVRAAVARAIAERAPGLFGLACSGGADSMALADAAIAVAGAPHVVVIAIDHGLQPGSADAVARVAAWARAQGAAAVTRRVEVARRASLEAAARDARYAALEAIAAELGLTAVLLGHTARDQVETIAMRILRGTGPAGLTGIPAVRGPFVRPLLGLPRAAIEAYVAARHLPAWEDPMNADPRFLRTRVRERILPALRAENPALDAALLRLAASAREWQDAIDLAARPLAQLPIDCARLRALPAAIRKRALALALDAAGVGHDAVHLDRLDALACAPARGEVALDLPGARLVKSYERLDLPRAGAPAAPLAAPPGHELRAWRPGDRMRPARLGGRSRKLSDLYGDAKLPRAARRSARVLVRAADGVIVWAEHVGAAYGEPVDLVPDPGHSGGSF